MSEVKITNTTDTALGLPGGPVVPAKRTISVKDWDKKNKGTVVQAWLRAGALTVEGDDADTSGSSSEAGNDTGGGAADNAGAGDAGNSGDAGASGAGANTPEKKTVEQLRVMTNAQLKDYIEEHGGSVAGNPNKDELIDLASKL